MADSRDQWTIKGFPYDQREMVIRAARQADLTVAEWLVQAARNEAARQAAQVVIPPGKSEASQDAGMPASQPEFDWRGLAALLEQTMRAEEMGLRGAKGARAAALALARDRSRQGLPKRGGGQPKGITGPVIEVSK